NVQENKIKLMLLDSSDSIKTISAFVDNFKLKIFLSIFSYNASCQRFIVYNYYFHFFTFFEFIYAVAALEVSIASSTAGILITTTKEFFSLFISTRSFLANKRYSRLLTEFNPNPVPSGICISASNGFITATTRCLSITLALNNIVTSPVVPYNPNLIAFSIRGWTKSAGIFQESASSAISICVLRR